MRKVLFGVLMNSVLEVTVNGRCLSLIWLNANVCACTFWCVHARSGVCMPILGESDVDTEGFHNWSLPCILKKTLTKFGACWWENHFITNPIDLS